jgi:inner membrane protein
VDPLCHTLVGAALGEAGLKRRTAPGMATLIIGANLPDIDVIALAFDRNLEFRRGWTHGVPALVVLPFLLTGLMLAWERWVRRGGQRRPQDRVIPSQVLLLASLSILTHPTLDFLNNYGMRWLMPFRDRWFYGDALFIVDPWMWLALGPGVLLARRWERQRRRDPAKPARWALGLTTIYAALMLAANPLGRWIVSRDLAARGIEPERLMVSPVPVSVLRREVVFQEGTRYRFGELRWLPQPRFTLSADTLTRGPVEAAVLAAARDRQARAFLHWARFPFVRVDTVTEGRIARIADARYTTDVEAGWASVAVPLDDLSPAPPAGDGGNRWPAGRHGPARAEAPRRRGRPGR